MIRYPRHRTLGTTDSQTHNHIPPLAIQFPVTTVNREAAKIPTLVRSVAVLSAFLLVQIGFQTALGVTGIINAKSAWPTVKYY